MILGPPPAEGPASRTAATPGGWWMTAPSVWWPRNSVVEELLDTVRVLHDIVSLSSSRSDDSGTEELRSNEPAAEEPAPACKSTVDGGSDPRRGSVPEALAIWFMASGGTAGGPDDGAA